MRGRYNRFYPVTHHEVEMKDPWKWVDDVVPIVLFMASVIIAAMIVGGFFN
jgi:hypothetical protein